MYYLCHNATLKAHHVIYLIVDKEMYYCKIGFSVEPKKRLKQLQTGCPLDLYIYGTIDGNQYVEREVHKLFKAYHIRNEWFNLSHSIIDYFTSDKTFK